jgi:hypothetical protein
MRDNVETGRIADVLTKKPSDGFANKEQEFTRWQWKLRHRLA